MRGPGGTDRSIGARRSDVAAARLRAQRVEVSVPRRVPPGARLNPLLTLFVSEDAANSDAPPLRALFELLDRAGASEVHRRTLIHTSWHLMEKDEDQVALRLEISEPADARGVVEVVMDAEDYQRAWESVRDGRWVGITSGQRLPPHADGSALRVDEVFAACIPVDADPPLALAAMARATS